MSTALEDVCNILDLSDKAKRERELLAQKIVALGEREAALLRDRVLREIAYGQGVWPTALVRVARSGAASHPSRGEFGRLAAIHLRLTFTASAP